ncbi:MAG: GatB/YqeY domain-containing protein [Bacteroidales bacterium]|nr:GatB/YqeY domain-containing protein [Bacteroidales bacterium]MCF8387544.1 GatB/YqeY domain-containing protein [Bacteroidales bacterium]MCF8397924.1 GatB/YqeY domain-containing protein [Bacteroidales bacterium]
MSLAEKINEDLKQAMKAKDAKKLEALRAIKAALLLAKTGKDAPVGDIPENVEMSMLQKLVKQRKESAAIYREKNRPELAEEEEYQASIIETYLPEQMNEEEMEAEIRKIIEETGAQSMKDMGKVMGIASKKFAGKADNKSVAAMVKKLLG